LGLLSCQYGGNRGRPAKMADKIFWIFSLDSDDT
jgi:hypothetical protein